MSSEEDVQNEAFQDPSEEEVALDEEEAPLEGARLHTGIAEQGKIYALEGDHATALFYYRKAMQMSVEAGHPEVFFRHYLDCVMESLEHTGSFPEVIEYCEKALDIYHEKPPENPITLRDLAHIYQKLGVIKLKTGDTEGAKEALQDALDVLQGSGQPLPLAETLLRWLIMNMHVDPQRILTEQEHAEYFTVRHDTVDRERAVKLPDELVAQQLHGGALAR